MCDTSFYTVSDFPKSVYCQSECDLLMDGLLHFQLKPHNANPATRRAIFSLATWQIADTHKNCANTCNCPKIFVQIRSIVRKYPRDFLDTDVSLDEFDEDTMAEERDSERRKVGLLDLWKRVDEFQ